MRVYLFERNGKMRKKKHPRVREKSTKRRVKMSPPYEWPFVSGNRVAHRRFFLFFSSTRLTRARAVSAADACNNFSSTFAAPLALCPQYGRYISVKRYERKRTERFTYTCVYEVETIFIVPSNGPEPFRMRATIPFKRRSDRRTRECTAASIL